MTHQHARPLVAFLAVVGLCAFFMLRSVAGVDANRALAEKRSASSEGPTAVQTVVPDVPTADALAEVGGAAARAGLPHRPRTTSSAPSATPQQEKTPRAHPTRASLAAGTPGHVPSLTHHVVIPATTPPADLKSQTQTLVGQLRSQGQALKQQAADLDQRASAVASDLAGTARALAAQADMLSAQGDSLIASATKLSTMADTLGASAPVILADQMASLASQVSTLASQAADLSDQVVALATQVVALDPTSTPTPDPSASVTPPPDSAAGSSTAGSRTSSGASTSSAATTDGSDPATAAQ